MIDPCLESLGQGKYRCKNTGLTFATTAANVRCCGPGGRPAHQAPATTRRPPAPTLPIHDIAPCQACRHFLPDGGCRMFRTGCDAHQRRAAALRNGCRFRRVKGIEPTTIPKDAFVTTADLIRLSQGLARELASENFDAVIGVARSGIIAASTIAVELHLPLFSVSPVSGRLHALGSGWRLGDEGNATPRAALLVDDTVANGHTLEKVRSTIKEIPIAAGAAILVNPDKRETVDFAAATYPLPHYLEWCFVNTQWARNMAFDFDGILCDDPAFPDDDPAYAQFLINAPAKYLPRLLPAVIVSARCEWTRQDSLKWLTRHRLRPRELILWQGDPDDRWTDPDRVANWKADHLRRLRNSHDILIYAESDPRQAAVIAAQADIAVLCPAAGTVYNADKHWPD